MQEDDDRNKIILQLPNAMSEADYIKASSIIADRYGNKYGYMRAAEAFRLTADELEVIAEEIVQKELLGANPSS